jgi:hypothetical protein
MIRILEGFIHDEVTYSPLRLRYSSPSTAIEMHI